jgi:hypothetical protein
MASAVPETGTIVRDRNASLLSMFKHAVCRYNSCGMSDAAASAGTDVRCGTGTRKELSLLLVSLVQPHFPPAQQQRP